MKIAHLSTFWPIGTGLSLYTDLLISGMRAHRPLRHTILAEIGSATGLSSRASGPSGVTTSTSASIRLVPLVHRAAGEARVQRRGTADRAR